MKSTLSARGVPCFAFVQEPERARKRDGVENIRADGDHHVYGVGFDELFAQLLLGGAGVGGGVGHDEAGAAFFVKRGVEKLNPEIVSVVGARQAEGIAAVLAYGVFEPVFVDGVDVERRIGEDEVEVAGAVVLVFVVRVGLADVAFESVDGEVHARQSHGGADPFLTVNGEFRDGFFRCSCTKRALCTNMPPEPQAGSSTRP